MMSETDSKARGVRCAVRGPENEAERAALTAWLDANGPRETVHFLPKDDDDLDADLCAGRFDCVLFPSVEALLLAIWEHHARLDRWAARGVRIEIADGRDSDHRIETILEVHESLRRWRARRRRRQIIAGVILSAVALLAMGVLLFWIPPAR